MRLTKPQRELLHRCRGGGVPWREIEKADHRVVYALNRRSLLLQTWVDNQTLIVTSKAGLAALTAPAPPPPAGRIACVNPMCWRTFAMEKNLDADEMICSECFKQTGRLRTEYRDLRALHRKLERRRLRRHGETIEVPLAAIGLSRRMDANWSAIKSFFMAGEKPEGLEAFLEEMNWHAEPETEDVRGLSSSNLRRA